MCRSIYLNKNEPINPQNISGLQKYLNTMFYIFPSSGEQKPAGDFDDRYKHWQSAGKWGWNLPDVEPEGQAIELWVHLRVMEWERGPLARWGQAHDRVSKSSMRQHSHNDSDIAVGLRKLDSSDGGSKSSTISRLQERETYTKVVCFSHGHPLAHPQWDTDSYVNKSLRTRSRSRMRKSFQIKQSGHPQIPSKTTLRLKPFPNPVLRGSRL